MGCPEVGEGPLAVCCVGNLESLALEDALQDLPVGGFVVDHEDVGHGDSWTCVLSMTICPV